MLYLLAAVGAITVGVLLWRAFGVQAASVSSRQGGTIAPDDDPEFLRRLDEHRKRGDAGDDPKS
ncbi:hypothetical protein V5P93_006928 [Actinokineospora auranticolor]|uniref:Uncharacterized protein n=1 Tax=Actinokineospora auranticolor TaxID=155976 RepID=A0A2S6GW76_9PSEU|nr:hypothetical protein [Actinokineospora auranticolor]PPK69430.1 hypothetical protein CLV40_10336 [Actinokineospora auranticolor]